MTLAAGQFVMALDTTVMNTAIATVANDLGTTVTGIQTAITFYTLVMASLMITGGKVGEIIGRKRAFAIGCVIYACGSLTTALSQNLTTLLIGWSFLEGIGAVLIMPAIVALVASNFGRPDRPRAYGLVAAAGAIACALGPVIGGAFTTYWLLAVGVRRRGAHRCGDSPSHPADERHTTGEGRQAGPGRHGAVRCRPRHDRVRHPALGLLGLRAAQGRGAGVARALARDLADAREAACCSSCSSRGRTGGFERGEGALLDPAMLRNLQLRNGVTSFLFLFLVQAGIFFVVPLFLSVALGMSAVATGVRLLPLSLMLLLFAVGVPKLLPNVSPRRVIRLGFIWRSSPAWCSCSSCSTTAPAPRSSPGRCCSPAPGSARSRHSSGA